MFKYLVLSVLFNVSLFQNHSCNDTLVNKVFDQNFKANYYLCIPVVIADSNAVLVIQKNELQKYMARVNIIFQNKDSVSTYLKAILNGSKKFYFSSITAKEIIGINNFEILTINSITTVIKNEIGFLRKNITDFNEDDIFFNLNVDFNPNEYYEIIYGLFKLNYLVAEGDGYIGVTKVTCTCK